MCLLSLFIAETCQRFDHFIGLHKNYLLVLWSKSVFFPVIMVISIIIFWYFLQAYVANLCLVSEMLNLFIFKFSSKYMLANTFSEYCLAIIYRFWYIMLTLCILTFQVICNLFPPSIFYACFQIYKVERIL